MQHITERNRIEQRIIQVEVTFHYCPKCSVREKQGSFSSTLDSVLRLVKTMAGPRGQCIEIRNWGVVVLRYESGNHQITFRASGLFIGAFDALDVQSSIRTVITPQWSVCAAYLFPYVSRSRNSGPVKVGSSDGGAKSAQDRLKQAKVRDVVICRGCKAVIRLDDYMNECRVALRRIKAVLQDFRESVKSLNFDIKLFRRGHHDSNRQINFWFAGK